MLGLLAASEIPGLMASLLDLFDGGGLLDNPPVIPTVLETTNVFHRGRLTLSLPTLP